MRGGQLLEREGERAAIGAAIEQARQGHGRVVLVDGPAGIGKTALLAEARRLANAAGLLVLAASGGPLERDFPFGVVRQLFEPLLHRSPERREELLAGAAALAAPIVAAAPPGSPAGDAFPALHGLYWLTANAAAAQPLLVAVDDAHWADAPSLRFLLYLARRLDGVPVTLVVAARTGEPANEPLAHLMSDPDTHVLRPAVLGMDAVAGVIDAALGTTADAGFVRACHAATDGNPFLVHELARALAAERIVPSAAAAARVPALGPETVGQATRRRLERLPAGAAALAHAVAVLGADATLHRAAQLAGIGDAAALLDALVAAGIVRHDARLEFVHPIVHAAVYEQLPAGERSAAHARAAALLGDEGADIDAVVAHLLLTAPTASPSVVDQLRAAAARALARGAPENAARYLTRALEEGVDAGLRISVLRELALAEKTLRRPAAREHLQQALRLAGSATLRAELRLQLAPLALLAGDWSTALALWAAGREELDDADDEVALRLDTLLAAAALYDPAHVGENERRLPALRRAVERGGAVARPAALALATRAALRGEAIEEVPALIERGLDAGAFIAQGGVESLMLAQAFGALLLTDADERAATLAQDVLRIARARGSVLGAAQAASHRAWLLCRRGDLLGGEAELRAALELVLEHDLAYGVTPTLWYCSEAILERRSLADVAVQAETLELPEPLAGTVSGAWLLELRGRLRALHGDWTGANDALQRCATVMQAAGVRNPNASHWRSALASALAHEDPERARALAEAELEEARRLGLTTAAGIALRTLGTIAGGDDGRTHLQAAARELERTPARLEHARALVELGAGLRRGGQRVAAREPLREGLALARACGATRLAERASEELAAAGARPRREVRSGVEALTPAERRAAALAADGMSNLQIAQALFVTVNTVETHLKHVYAKLGIRRRAELTDALRANRQ